VAAIWGSAAGWPSGRTQLPPATRGCKVERQDTVAVDAKNAIKPTCKRGGKIRIFGTLQSNAAFDLADADEADEKIIAALSRDPGFDVAVPDACRAPKERGYR
jgi:hypothetical protein